MMAGTSLDRWHSSVIDAGGRTYSTVVHDYVLDVGAYRYAGDMLGSEFGGYPREQLWHRKLVCILAHVQVVL